MFLRLLAREVPLITWPGPKRASRTKPRAHSGPHSLIGLTAEVFVSVVFTVSIERVLSFTDESSRVATRGARGAEIHLSRAPPPDILG